MKNLIDCIFLKTEFIEAKNHANMNLTNINTDYQAQLQSLCLNIKLQILKMHNCTKPKRHSNVDKIHGW